MIDIDMDIFGEDIGRNMGATTQGATDVQRKRAPPAGKPWLSVAGPKDDTELVVDRLSLDVGVSDLDFLDRYAAYRNASAAAGGKKLKRKWSRKSMGEELLALKCAELKHEMQAMFEACGELPPSEDKAAMERYVKRVASWDETQSKAKK
jgi:hypothetical protein